MTRLERWTRATTWPLIVAAFAYLAAYAAPILRPDLQHPAWGWVTWGTWVMFAVDYLVRIYLAPHRWAYVKTHPLDLALVALPLLRPLRLLRIVTLLVTLNHRATTTLRGKVLTYLIGASLLLGFCAAVAVYDAERGHPEANIINFGDAAWWALATMTTVGYGDRYPITTTGRWIAAGLMIGGVAILGTVTATIASWLVENLNQGERPCDQPANADTEPNTSKHGHDGDESSSNSE